MGGTRESRGPPTLLRPAFLRISSRVTRIPRGTPKSLYSHQTGIHARQTRHGNTNLVCPPYKRETEGGGSFTVSSIELWNSLPNLVKKSETFNSFNKAIRSYFLAQYDHIDNLETLIFNTLIYIVCIIIFIILYLHLSYFLMISLVSYAFYYKFYCN